MARSVNKQRVVNRVGTWYYEANVTRQPLTAPSLFLTLPFRSALMS